MNYDESFIESNLPKPLSKEELYSYLEQYKQGDLKAREQVITCNIRLVLNRVSRKFANTPYDKKDLISIGIIGLLNSVDKFDIDKNFEFSTFAARCIDNEILMFLRKFKKYTTIQSLYTPICIDKEGTEKKLEDILEDEAADFVSDHENKFIYDEVRKIVYNLPNRDREIILMYFGFIDNHPYTQQEIADKIKMSQTYVSKIITSTVKKIGIQLQDNGVIETVGRSGKKTKPTSIEFPKRQTPSKITTIGDKSVVESEDATPIITSKREIIPKTEERNEEKMRGKRLQTIYEYLKGYTKEEIDVMLSKLSDEEMDLIKLRYGEDLNNPVTSSTWEKEQNDKFYGSLIPKMKRLLSNPNRTRKKYTKRQKVETGSKPSEVYQPSNIILNQESTEKKEVTPQLITPEEPKKESSQKESSQPITSEIDKEDYVRILELMRTSSFGKMLKTLTPKEAVIICLKLGYVDGKYFTTESVAGFLGIENEEVIETTKKVLLLYEENINQFIDKAVEVATGSSLVLKKKEN